MSNRKTLRALTLVALSALGLVGCDNQESSSVEPLTPEETAEAVWSILDVNYTTLRTTGILTDYTYDLIATLADFPEVEISYEVNPELTTFEGRISYTLGAQSLLHLDPEEPTVLYVEDATVPETDSWAAFTAHLTIEDQTFSRDYLVAIKQNTVISIEYILDNEAELTDTQITLRGVWMGTNGIITSGYTTYNAAYVADGEFAMQLYRPESELIDDEWVIGETVIEVVGTYSPYNGLPEVGSITSIREVENARIDAPVTLTFTSETDVSTLTKHDINRKVHVDNVEIASINRSNQYGNLYVNLKLASDTQFQLFMDSRYNDVDPWAEGLVDAGDIVSFDTFIGWNNNSYQLTYYSNLVVHS